MLGLWDAYARVRYGVANVVLDNVECAYIHRFAFCIVGWLLGVDYDFIVFGVLLVMLNLRHDISGVICDNLNAKS